MILLIDNYDSFAHNLARYLRQLEVTVQVVRNDRVTLHEITALAPQAIVISPGPCTPNESGICLELVRHCFQTTPILGVCLGHQTICQALGGKIGRTLPRHGQTSWIHHQGHALFSKTPNPFPAGRYHSLMMEPDSVPDSLEVIATTEDGMVMGVSHRQHAVYGLQFHPESILTPCGYRLLGNFLNLASIPCNEKRIENLSRDLAIQSKEMPTAINKAELAGSRTNHSHPFLGVKYPT